MTDPTTPGAAEPTASRGGGAEPTPPGGAGTEDRAANYRPPDPERGLRGAMSALLVLEAITILLGIPVAENTGDGAGPVGVVLICALAAAHVAACAVVARPFAFGLIAMLQVLLIACWAISGPLGVMGIVFGLVWGAIFWMRREFRRRVSSGRIPVVGSDPMPDR